MDSDWWLDANCDVCEQWARVEKLGELWLCNHCMNYAAFRRQRTYPNQHYELCADCDQLIDKYAGVLALGRWWHLHHFTQQSHTGK